MYLFFNIFTYVAEVFIIYTYTAGMFEKKFSTSKTLIIGLVVFTFPFILNQLWNNPVVNIFTFPLATTVFLYLTHHIKIKHAVLQGVILTAIMFVTEILCSYSILLLLGQSSFLAYKDSVQVYVMSAIGTKLFFLIACKICNYFVLRKNKLYSTPLSYFVFAVAVSFSTLVLTFLNI